MLKKENPASKWRTALLKTLSEKELPMSLQVKIVEPMANQPDYEKELIAKELLDIVKNSEDEQSILKALENLNL